MRNPRDVCCSWLNHARILQNYTGNFDTIVDAVLADELPLFGPYFTHVFSYWNRRHLSNLLIITYEEMQADLAAVLRKVAGFLGVGLSETDIPKLCEHLSFDSMKKNSSVNYTARTNVSLYKGLLSFLK